MLKISVTLTTGVIISLDSDEQYLEKLIDKYVEYVEHDTDGYQIWRDKTSGSITVFAMSNVLLINAMRL